MPSPERKTCTCGQELVMLLTDKGKRMPCHAETVDAADEYWDRERHTTHWGNCPDAQKFRPPKQTTLKYGKKGE